MINIRRTKEEFGYTECGMSKPVVATCPVCGADRITGKRNADSLCRACTASHQVRSYQRISVKTFEQRAAAV